ncbi:hypothetical protein [Pseudoduganella plicata]|uniref:Uncharacterized protein n=1 Tax=Pseudoduganella plicata TaxID=321984 RepID=A0ABX5SA59_9BURK|nr:hypothetical protein [Pseudoduganella plicata]QBQ36475.1 hypothetical protein E1742_10100 [Pseudoduganella plicata]
MEKKRQQERDGNGYVQFAVTRPHPFRDNAGHAERGAGGAQARALIRLRQDPAKHQEKQRMADQPRPAQYERLHGSALAIAIAAELCGEESAGFAFEAIVAHGCRNS